MADAGLLELGARWLYRLEINIGTSALLGVIGAGWVGSADAPGWAT